MQSAHTHMLTHTHTHTCYTHSRRKSWHYVIKMQHLVISYIFALIVSNSFQYQLLLKKGSTTGTTCIIIMINMNMSSCLNCTWHKKHLFQIWIWRRCQIPFVCYKTFCHVACLNNLSRAYWVVYCLLKFDIYHTDLNLVLVCSVSKL